MKRERRDAAATRLLRPQLLFSGRARFAANRKQAAIMQTASLARFEPNALKSALGKAQASSQANFEQVSASAPQKEQADIIIALREQKLAIAVAAAKLACQREMHASALIE